MKNILFIERSLDPTSGGVERVSYILSQAFQKKGYTPYFLYFNKDSNLVPFDRKYKFNESDDIQTLFQVFSSFIIKNQIDIIICQNVHFSKYQIIYKNIKSHLDVKFITCFHGNPDIWVNKNKWGCTTKKIYFKELIRSCMLLFKNPFKERMVGMYKISDRYVLLSNSFVPVFKNLYHINEDNKLVAISNPCTFKQEKNNATNKENIVIVVARMAEQQKRISNVLKIWGNIFPNFSDWKLILVGNGPDLTLYKKMSEKLNLQNINFIGHSTNVEDFYKKSKIFLSTSIWEGLPMTILEAQNYGCVPIAFNNYAAIHDIIENGKNGYIIQSHNINEFSDKLSILMKNESLLSSLSTAAKVSSNQHFNIDRILLKWEKMFNDLI